MPGANALLVARLPLAGGGSRDAFSSLTRDDVHDLAELWLRSYPDHVTADETFESVTDDMLASFDGAYGPLRLDASLALRDSAAILGAVMVVDRAPWPDVPDCPFVIELFVDPAVRSSGWGRRLLRASTDSLAETGAREVALRVERRNVAASRLYASEGFEER